MKENSLHKQTEKYRYIIVQSVVWKKNSGIMTGNSPEKGEKVLVSSMQPRYDLTSGQPPSPKLNSQFVFGMMICL